jgi:hypothetical protein
VLTLGHDCHSNLTSITDVDHSSRTLGYESNHHVTSDSWTEAGTVRGDRDSNRHTEAERRRLVEQRRKREKAPFSVF